MATGEVRWRDIVVLHQFTKSLGVRQRERTQWDPSEWCVCKL